MWWLSHNWASGTGTHLAACGGQGWHCGTPWPWIMAEAGLSMESQTALGWKT